jgi:hypothetical protein
MGDKPQFIKLIGVYGRDSWAKTIELSLPFIQVAAVPEVMDTILHEIAHALTPGGHTKAWKATAAAIGATPKRCSEFHVPRNRRIRGRRIPDARQEFFDFGGESL